MAVLLAEGTESLSESAGELVQDRDQVTRDLFPRFKYGEELGPVDFGDFYQSSRTFRMLNPDNIALDACCIAVALNGPYVDCFSISRSSCKAEVVRFSFEWKTQLFFEFPAGNL